MSHAPYPSVDASLAAELRNELADGERVLWCARPTPGGFSRGSWWIAPFGCFFAGFAIIWMGIGASIALLAAFDPAGSGSFSGFIGLVFLLTGIPILWAGVYIATGPIRARRAAAQTVYGLTDRRVIAVEGGWRGGARTVSSYGPQDILRSERVEHANGVGDVIFRREIVNGADRDRVITRPRGLIGIENVADVERLIREVLRERV
ncbi:MAG: hypothetical protein ACOYN0_02035 [Phycisphaerales bacterium]